MTPHTDDKVNTWERHIRTFTSAIALLLMGWMGSTLVQMGQDVAVIKAQLPALMQVNDRLSAIGERVALLEFQRYNKGDK